MNAALRWSMRILAGVALLATTFWWASPADFVSTLARTNPTAVLALLGMIFQILMSAERWRLLIRAAGISLRSKDAVQISFVASLSSQILPGGVEVARIGMGRLTGMEWSKLVTMSVVDRVLLVLALLATAACGLAVISPTLRPVILCALGIAGLAAGGVVGWFALGGRIPHFTVATSRFPALRPVLGAGALRPALLLRAAAFALLGPANLAVTAWLLAASMQIPLSIGAALTWIPLVLAAAAVPVSLGGWGVREAAAVALLGQAGIPASEAFALSVGLGLAALIAALPGAFMLPTGWRTPSPAL